MKPSSKQQSILNLLSESGGMVTKKDVVNKFGGSYFCNPEKYIGDILSNMVKVGLLTRIKRGVFKSGPGRIKKTRIDYIDDPNQLKLFEG